MKKYSKLKHQIKSTPYYIFWAIATITVSIGQIYVGSGYRQMSEEIKTLNQTILNKLMEKESKFLPLLNQSRSF
jgi:cell division protein FtsL